MESHAQRMAAREDAERNQLSASIRKLLERVPAGYATWGVTKVREYKDAASKARDLAAKPKAAIRNLRMAEMTLKRLYQGN